MYLFFIITFDSMLLTTSLHFTFQCLQIYEMKVGPEKYRRKNKTKTK